MRRSTKLYWAVFLGLFGMWLVCREAAWGAEIVPSLKGAWPEYGSATAKAVAANRDFAYIAAGEAGLLVFNVSDPSQPRPVGRLPLQGSASDIVLAGDYAYVANEGVGAEANVIFAGLDVIDIRQPALPVQVAHLESTGRAVQVAVSGTRVLIVNGGYSTENGYTGTGVEVIDVEDPGRPRRIGRIDATGQVSALAASGDLACVIDQGKLTGGSYYLSVIHLAGSEGPRKVGQYQVYGGAIALAMVGNLAYLAQNSSLTVIDLALPARPRKLGETWLDGAWGEIGGIAVSGSNAFLAGAREVCVVNISNPTVPVQTSCQQIATPDNGFASPKMSGLAMSGSRLYRTVESFYTFFGSDKTSLLDVIDCSNSNNLNLITTYTVGIATSGLALSGSMAFLASGFAGLQILDVSEPARPRLISNFMKQTDAAIGVALARNLVCLRGFRGFDVVDVTDPRQPGKVGAYVLDTNEWMTAISAAGNRAFLGVSGSSSFLDVIDLSTPSVPQRLMRYDTSSWLDGLPASPYFTYVPDATEGWLIRDVSDPAQPAVVGGYCTIANALGVTVSGAQAHSLFGDIFDISDPAHPRRLGWVDPGDARPVSRSGNLVCSAGTQGFQCYDVSDPSNVRLVGRFPTPSPAMGVILRGTDAFVAAGESGFLVLDISRPAPSNLPALEFSPVSLPDRDYARGIAVSGDLAFVAYGGAGLKIVDVKRPEQATGIGEHRTDGFAYGVAVTGDHAFLAAGDAGLEIFDVLDPGHPRRVGWIRTSSRAQDVVISSGYAYVVLEGQWTNNTVRGAGVEVIDIRNPASPQHVGGFETDGPVVQLVVAGKQAYVAGMSSYTGPPWAWRGGYVDVLDLADSSQLRRVGRFLTSGPATALGYANGLLCVVDLGEWSGWGYERAHVAVLDAADPAIPRKIGELALGERGGYSPGIGMAGHYAYLVLPEQGGLHVLDLSDPAHPRRVNETFTLGAAADLAISGTRLYTASDSGVKVVDITNGPYPRWLGGYGEGTHINELVFAPGHAVATTWDSGLLVLDLSDPLQVRRQGFHVTQSPVSDAAIAGDVACVAERGDWNGREWVGGRLSIIDLKEPAHPRRVGTYELSGSALAVAVSGQRACLALGYQGIQVADISDPAAPRRLGGYDTSGFACDVAVEGNYVYVADGTTGLQVIDISHLPELRRAGNHPTGGAAQRVAVSGHRAHVWDNTAGLLTFDINDPARPRLLNRLATTPEGGSVSFSEGYACVVDASGLRVLDLQDPPGTRLAASHTIVAPGSVAALDSGRLYLRSSDPLWLGVAEMPPFFRSIARVGGTAHIEWEGWGRARLEGTTSLTDPNWRDLGVPESANSVSLPATNAHGFFRLHKP